MQILNSALFGLSSLTGKAWRFVRPGFRPDDAFDPYEKVPLQGEMLTNLFADDLRGPISQRDHLLVSERLERDTMSMIRGAARAAEYAPIP